MKVLPHKLYRQLTPILFFPLLATALTGIIYGIGDRLVTLPNMVANGLIAVHQGLFLGEKIAPIYALLMGLGVFALGLKALVESKSILLSWQSEGQNTGNIYRLLGLIIAIPLAFCVETGVAYQIGRDWFGMSGEQTSIFLAIHGGNSLGKFLGILYILVTGLGLIALSIIGYKMTSVSVVQRQQNKPTFAQKTELSADLSHDIYLDEVTIMRKNVRAAVYLFALVFIAILYSATTKLLVSILIIGIIFVLPALVVSEKVIRSWRNQKVIQEKMYEREAESITMLKAVPDSMLRVSQDGICLSYMPAKEGKCFILDGDIINRHLSEFLALEIAKAFINFSHLALKTGTTHFHRFPIFLDDEKRYHEARINPIGQDEVLIMVREIPNFDDTAIEFVQPSYNNNQQEKIQLLTELELTNVLEKTLEDIQQNPKNHILFCLAIEQTETNHYGKFELDNDLIYQIVNKIDIYLTADAISFFDNNGLVILVKNCSLQKASALVDDLHRSIQEFASAWQNGTSSMKVNVGLLQINSSSLDAISLMNTARTTCEMAKQKVSVKTFW